MLIPTVLLTFTCLFTKIIFRVSLPCFFFLLESEKEENYFRLPANCQDRSKLSPVEFDLFSSSAVKPRYQYATILIATDSTSRFKTLLIFFYPKKYSCISGDISTLNGTNPVHEINMVIIYRTPRDTTTLKSSTSHRHTHYRKQ